MQDYLLSDTHPTGSRKARFFKGLGFRRDRPSELITALQRVAVYGEVVDLELTPFGTKYVVQGMITGTNGPSRGIRTVWIIEGESALPRLVTAYPGPPSSMEDA